MPDFRVGEGSTFQVESFSSSATAFRVSILVEYDNGKQAPFEVGHTPNSDRTSATDTIGDRVNRDGHVISALLESAALKRGQCFATIHVLNTSGNKVDALLAGYVTATKSVRLGQFEDSFSGKGFLRTVSLGNPAAGSDYTAESVPTNAVWMVRSSSGALTTDAGSQSRIHAVTFDDGANEYARGTTTTAQGASVTRVWYGGQSLSGHGLGTQGVNVTYPFVYMMEGDRVLFNTDQLQAGDNWAEGFIQVEEWIVP